MRYIVIWKCMPCDNIIKTELDNISQVIGAIKEIRDSKGELISVSQI